MQSLMMITHSSKTSKRILSIVFTIGLALVLAFCPIAQTVAYAEAVDSLNEIVSYILSFVAADVSANTFLVLAGCAVSPVILSSTIYSLIILLVACGIGIVVGTVVRLLTSESFSVAFWETLKTSWDRTVHRFKCSAAMFSVLVQQVKSYFGIGVEDHNDYYTDFPFRNSKTPVNVDYYKSKYPQTSLVYNFYFKPLNKDVTHTHRVINNFNDYILCQCVGCGTYGCNFPIVNDTSCSVDPLCDFELSDKTVTITMRNTGNTISFSNISDNGDCRFIPYPVVYNKELYFAFLTCYNYDNNYLCSINSKLKYNGYVLGYSSEKKTCYINDGTSNTYLYFLFSDGVIEPVDSQANFLYNLFIAGGSVVQCKTALTNVTTTDDITDDIKKSLSVAGSVDGVIPKDADATTVKPKSKDVTYDKTNDVTKTVVGKLTGVNVKSGDVVIEGSGVKGLDITDSLDIADTVSITNVAAEDVVIEDTATGTDVSLPADGFIDWVLGVNLIKSASSGITEKFPFCIPTYLKSQLNILVAEEKEPIFKIPFKIKSANIGGDIEIDLTRFDSLIKITDFFLLAILVVGLAFSTKKMFF